MPATNSKEETFLFTFRLEYIRNPDIFNSFSFLFIFPLLGVCSCSPLKKGEGCFALVLLWGDGSDCLLMSAVGDRSRLFLSLLASWLLMPTRLVSGSSINHQLTALLASLSQHPLQGTQASETLQQYLLAISNGSNNADNLLLVVQTAVHQDIEC